MKTRNGLFADVPENLWNDWHWQVANRAETVEDLKKYMNLTPDEEEGVRKTLGKLRMAVTPYYLSLIDLDDPFDPIRKMAIPRAEELEYADYEDADPLHEDTDSPTPGLMELGVYTDVIVADCTKPVEVMEAALAANDGKEYDLSICCVNIESCEMSAILPVRDDGLVYFFSMATSFTKAALGAEGIGKDVTMIIGNGYTLSLIHI